MIRNTRMDSSWTNPLSHRPSWREFPTTILVRLHKVSYNLQFKFAYFFNVNNAAVSLTFVDAVMASIAIRCSVSSTGEDDSGESLDPRICVSI